MFGSIGMPELIIIFGFIIGPWFLFYRLGYNSGYRKALEKRLAEPNARGDSPDRKTRQIDLDD